jgi:Ca2+-binding EF-hand superfamily protein
VGVIDEEDFVELFKFVRSGEAKDIGKHSSVSSRYEKKRADMRSKLHHHTKTHVNEEGTASARQSFQKKAEDEGQDGKLEQGAFKDLVKKLFVERGGTADALPSDEDLAALFALEDTNNFGSIDEDDFLELLSVVESGEAVGLGKHSSISSKYNKKRIAIRDRLHHHTGSIAPNALSGESNVEAADPQILLRKRFESQAAEGNKEGKIDLVAFRRLTQQIMTEVGDTAALPSDKDLDAVFDLATSGEEHGGGLLDFDGFLKVFKIVQSGEAKGTGKHSLTSSQYEKKRETVRASLEEPLSKAKSILDSFRAKAAEGGKDGSLDQNAFRQLVKDLITDHNGPKSVPSDKDIDAAFECEDVQHIGRIDEEDFLDLYELIRSGKAKGLGSHSITSSKYEKKRAEARKSLHHHTASSTASGE